MSTVVYEKRCTCEPATASGPRVVHDEAVEEDGVRVRFTYVQMACDECDTPWRRADWKERMDDRDRILVLRRTLDLHVQEMGAGVHCATINVDYYGDAMEYAGESHVGPGVAVVKALESAWRDLAEHSPTPTPTGEEADDG